MRFETTETVPTTDSEHVLRVLAQCLEEISDNITREDSKIVLRGLGPSPRARNYRDITVFDVSAGQNGTVIHADINFQASALLGPGGQQDVVRSKLNYVFHQLRFMLGVENQPAVAPVVEFAHRPSPLAEAATPPNPAFSHEKEAVQSVPFTQPHFAPAAPTAPIKPSGAASPLPPSPAPSLAATPTPPTPPAPRPSTPLYSARPTPPLAPPPEAIKSTPPETPAATPPPVAPSGARPAIRPAAPVPRSPSGITPRPMVRPPSGSHQIAPLPGAAKPNSTATPPVPSTKPVSGGQPVASTKQVSGAQPVASTKQVSGARPTTPAKPPSGPQRKHTEATMFRFAAPEPTRSRRVPAIILSIVSVVLLGEAGYLYWTGYFTSGEPKGRDLLQRLHLAPSPATPTPQQTPSPQASATPPASAAPAVVHHTEEDPHAFLDSWAEAMRGHDASLQASFYADPVNYLDRPDVSHDALVDTLSRAISSRSHLWTFKIDRFATEEQKPDYLRLRFTKHFVQLGDTPNISEKLTRSRMELKRIDGEWKITVEHDFPQGAAT